MGKDPAFLFYSSDFITGTMYMTDEQCGRYVRLLCHQHQSGGMIKTSIFNSVAKNDPVIIEKFIETDDGFFNERLMLEMNKRIKKSSSLSENAKKRWVKHSNAMQLHNKSNATESELQMPIEDEDINVIIDSNVTNISNNINTHLEISNISTQIEIIKKTTDITTWRTSYEFYVEDHDNSYLGLIKNQEYLDKLKKGNPDLNIILSIENAKEYWRSDEGWKHKKSSRTKDLNWVSTYRNSVRQPMNRVFENKPKQSQYGPQKVDRNEIKRIFNSVKDKLV